jgi:hypothetical protein
MRKMFTSAAIVLALFILASPPVMAGNGNGSSNIILYHFFQWLRDADGDGIPNCLDPDYVPPKDGTGYGKLGASLGSGSGGNDITPIRDRDRDRDKDKDCDGDGNLYDHNYEYLYNYGGSRK